MGELWDSFQITVTHIPRGLPGLLTHYFLWSHWQRKCSWNSWCIHNLQFFVFNMESPLWIFCRRQWLCYTEIQLYFKVASFKIWILFAGRLDASLEPSLQQSSCWTIEKNDMTPRGYFLGLRYLYPIILLKPLLNWWSDACRFILLTPILQD